MVLSSSRGIRRTQLRQSCSYRQSSAHIQRIGHAILILLMMEQATVATIRPQNTYGPLPAHRGYGKVAEYPIHALVKRKAMARVERVENCRGSSPLWPCARSSSSSADSRPSWAIAGCTECSLADNCESLILNRNEAETAYFKGRIEESEKGKCKTIFLSKGHLILTPSICSYMDEVYCCV